jgi:aminoglycoside phosphotransferase (APT) family kinase protein
MPGPKERDLEATRVALRGWLGSKLPGAEKLEISELSGPSATGFSSDTLLFDASYDIDGESKQERLVARLEPRGFTVFPFNDVSIQYRAMQALRKTDVPVPRMRWLETNQEMLGSAFYVMDRVEGVPVTDTPPYHMGGWVSELGEADQARLWWNGLDALCAIHRLDWRALGFQFLQGPDGVDPLTRQLDEYESYFCWAVKDRARYAVIQRGLAWLRQNAPAGEPVELCWGDSRPSNQMFRDLECVAVLDWEMVRLGNPVQDVAWWIAIDRCLSEGIGVPRLPGLPTADQTLAHWSAATGLSADHFEYYETLAFLKFSVIMARLGLQMKHYEVAPEDSQMDVSNLASFLLERSLDGATAVV